MGGGVEGRVDLTSVSLKRGSQKPLIEHMRTESSMRRTSSRVNMPDSASVHTDTRLERRATQRVAWRLEAVHRWLSAHDEISTLTENEPSAALTAIPHAGTPKCMIIFL